MAQQPNSKAPLWIIIFTFLFGKFRRRKDEDAFWMRWQEGNHGDFLFKYENETVNFGIIPWPDHKRTNSRRIAKLSFWIKMVFAFLGEAEQRCRARDLLSIEETIKKPQRWNCNWPWGPSTKLGSIFIKVSTSFETVIQKHVLLLRERSWCYGGKRSFLQI